MNSICSTCNVNRHDLCIYIATEGAVACSCAAAEHTLYTSVSLRTGLLVKETHPRAPLNGMRKIDYDIEPFEQVGPRDKGKGGKYGKPEDDITHLQYLQTRES